MVYTVTVKVDWTLPSCKVSQWRLRPNLDFFYNYFPTYTCFFFWFVFLYLTFAYYHILAWQFYQFTQLSYIVCLTIFLPDSLFLPVHFLLLFYMEDTIADLFSRAPFFLLYRPVVKVSGFNINVVTGYRLLLNLNLGKIVTDKKSVLR